jgi:trigger factor
MASSSSPLVSLENEHVQVSVARHPECRVVLTITTLPLASKAAKSAALKTVLKQVNIPGFRKGHAPDSLVLKQFAPQIEREFRNILVRNGINEAIRLTKIIPTQNNEAIKLLKFEPLESDTYFISVEFESYPEVPSVDFDSLSIQEMTPKTIEQSEIDNRVEDLRLRHAEWEEILDRPANEGDFATLDIEVMEQEPFFIHQDTKFHLVDKKMPLWARSLVEGLRVGESKEGPSEPEEGDDAASFESKLCKITVKKIQTANLPPIDDELAKKAGVQNVDELSAAIHRSLEKNARGLVQNGMRKQVKTQLLELYPIDIPGQHMEKLRQNCEQIAENAKSQFPNEEQWNQYKERLFEQGKETTRLSYLLPKVLREHHQPLPTHDEVQQRATEQMMLRYFQGDTSLTEGDLKYFAQVAESEILTETALDFIIANCKKA